MGKKWFANSRSGARIIKIWLFLLYRLYCGSYWDQNLVWGDIIISWSVQIQWKGLIVFKMNIRAKVPNFSEWLFGQYLMNWPVLRNQTLYNVPLTVLSRTCVFVYICLLSFVGTCVRTYFHFMHLLWRIKFFCICIVCSITVLYLLLWIKKTCLFVVSNNIWQLCIL